MLHLLTSCTVIDASQSNINENNRIQREGKGSNILDVKEEKAED